MVMVFLNRYTELFFLDEATAMAAGHRPCACCRRNDYTAFMAAVRASGPERSAWSAPQLDEALQAERLREKDDPGCRGFTTSKRLHTAELNSLPDGVMLALDEAAQDAWLLWKGALHRWSHEGYTEHVPLPADDTNVQVLTPPTLVAAIAAGFEPQPPHESVIQPRA